MSFATIVRCAMTHFTTLIDVRALSSQLGRDDFVIFDCRFDLANVHWGESQFADRVLSAMRYEFGRHREPAGSVEATAR